MGRISMPQGKGSQLHNRRDYEKIGRKIPENIDSNLSSENITLVDLDIKQAYSQIFGEALKEYNDKQTRANRKIDDYFEHVKKSKNKEKLFYEDVLQWGKKEDFEKDPKLKITAKKALVQYAKDFEKRNPNLKVIGSYIHLDEASPHLHLDYIPVAHGYSRGLSKRNSLSKAFKEMGFVPKKETRKNNSTKLWKENEREYFKSICKNLGLEVEEERKARGSLSVEEYKEAKEDMLGDVLNELEDVLNELEGVKQERNDLKIEINKLKSDLKAIDDLIVDFDKIDSINADFGLIGNKKVKINTKDFNKLKNTAKKVKILQSKLQEFKLVKQENIEMKNAISEYREKQYEYSKKSIHKELEQTKLIQNMKNELFAVKDYLIKNNQLEDYHDFRDLKNKQPIQQKNNKISEMEL